MDPFVDIDVRFEWCSVITVRAAEGWSTRGMGFTHVSHKVSGTGCLEVTKLAASSISSPFECLQTGYHMLDKQFFRARDTLFTPGTVQFGFAMSLPLVSDKMDGISSIEVTFIARKTESPMNFCHVTLLFLVVFSTNVTR